MALKDKKLFLLDMDGTIYLSNQLFDGTLDFLEHVRKKGGRYIFLTNNSSRGIDAYLERMKHFHIPCGPEDFVTSTDATIVYLKKHYGDVLYYVCGTESLKKQLRDAGLRLSEGWEQRADVVLLGYDTELNYEKLENCCILLNRGADYVATHADPVCPVWYGSAPDCGSVIEMLFTATGRRPYVVGKPQPDIVELAMKRAGCSREETCVMGDRVYTDIACGVNAGVDSIFVLSGEGVPSDIDKYGVKPTFIFKDIREVLNELIKEESE